MADFENELKLCFIDDASDLVRNAERVLMDLEKGENREAGLNELFRIAHNIKGSAAAVGFESLSKFTHRLESVLLPLKKGEAQLSPGMVTLLLHCVDFLSTGMGQLRDDLNAAISNPELTDELERVQECIKSNQDPFPVADTPEEPEVYEAPVAAAHLAPVPPPALTEMATPTPAPAPLETAPLAAAPPQVQAPAPAPATAPAKPAPTSGGGSSSNAANESIRVPLPKIEQLLNDIGELVILQTVMSQNQRSLASLFLRKTVLQMEKIIRSVQENSMSLRMLSLKPTFQKLERIVRDSSNSLGKEVVLKTSGEENELDKTMLEQIADPLVHIIRNSVDHGIEMPDEREKAGKPRLGTIFLSAYQRGGHMVLEIRDNGKGLDPVKIKAVAIERGVIRPDAVLSDDEIRKLIFLPGFSTKKEVTSLSGRGVGMDVVRTNIESLQGRVELTSEVGKGTTLKLVLPITLAIVDGIVVQSNEDRFVIPLNQILEYYRPTAADLSTIVEKGELLVLRGESLPLLRMDGMVRLGGGAGGAKKKAATASTVLVVQTTRNGKAGIVVDKILRQQQVVIKKLSKEIQGMPGIMGGAILGDGRVALILDMLDWVDRSLNSSGPSKGQGAGDTRKDPPVKAA